MLQPHEWYVCPVNKKAQCKITCKCTGVGASLETYLEVNGVRVSKWKDIIANTNAGPNSIFAGASTNRFLSLDVPAILEFSLNAGEKIETTQDGAFTNAEFDVNLQVQETPV